MSDSHTPHEGERTGEALGHERTDAKMSAIVIFLVVLFGAVILIQPLVFWLMNTFAAQARKSDPVLSPLADTEQIPPEPRLQADPTADMVELRRKEAELLASYAWIDKQQGIVRIPIDRAIDLLLERGLPVPRPTEDQSTGGEQPKASGESSQKQTDVPSDSKDQPQKPSPAAGREEE